MAGPMTQQEKMLIAQQTLLRNQLAIMAALVTISGELGGVGSGARASDLRDRTRITDEKLKEIT